MERSRMRRMDEGYYSSRIKEVGRKDGDCIWQFQLER